MFGTINNGGVGPRAPRLSPVDPTRVPFVNDVAAGVKIGGTYGADSGRYIIGGESVSWTIPAHFTAPQRAAVASEFADRAGSRAALGFWRDADGRTVLDVVTTRDSRINALQIAAARGETAIYDTVANVEIAV